MAEVATTANPQKRPLGDENAGGAIDAQDASKKPRTAATADAPTVELTKEVKEAAKAFQKHANKLAPGWNPQKGEDAAALVERVAGQIRTYTDIARPVVQELDSKFTRKWSTGKVRNAIKRALTGVSAAAFVAAGAPPKKKEEEGYVAGIIDIRSVKGDGDQWHRYDSGRAFGNDATFLKDVSKQQMAEALKRLSDPTDTYAKKRGFEVRRVTDATRHATATNKVVRGYHREHIAQADRNYTSAKDRLDAEAKRIEKERKAKVADAARAKEKKEVDYVIRCAELGLAVVAAPPLPDGATDEDRERLEGQALEALYGL